MKATIEKAAFIRAMNHANSVVERRNTIPILANVLIEAQDDTISFRATDLDIELIDRVSGVVEQAGATTVNAGILHEIVRKLPDGAMVALFADPISGRLEVSAGRSKFSLATLPREDFPLMAVAEYESNFSLAPELMRRLIDKTRFAMSNEETRYYLNGVYFHIAERDGAAQIRAVATDGHRLARLDVECPEDAQGMAGVIIPRKTVNELRKLVEGDDHVAVSVSETKIRFATPEVVLTSKVIDGTFPDYTRVIPSGNQKRLEVDAKDLATAVDRVATVSSERSRAVKFALTEDRLDLVVQSPDSGSAQEELAVAYADDPLEIGFNAKYLNEIASQIDRENAVIMLNTPGDPALITEGGDEGTLYVVMPMRV